MKKVLILLVAGAVLASAACRKNYVIAPKPTDPSYGSPKPPIMIDSLALYKNPTFSDGYAPYGDSSLMGSYQLQNIGSKPDTIAFQKIGYEFQGGLLISDLSWVTLSYNGMRQTQIATPNNGVVMGNTWILKPGEFGLIEIRATIAPKFGMLRTTLQLAKKGSTTLFKPAIPTSGQQITLYNPHADSVHVTTLIASSTAQQYIAVGTTSGLTDGSWTDFQLTGAENVRLTTLSFEADPGITSLRIGSMVAPVIAGKASLTGLFMNVPAGGNGLKLRVYASYGAVGASGIHSGTKMSFKMSGLRYSGSVFVSQPVSAQAPTMKIVAAKPSASMPNISSPLTLGQQNTLGEITIAADPVGKTSLHRIAWTVENWGIKDFDISYITLSDKVTGIASATCALSSDKKHIECDFLLDFPFYAGSPSRTYLVKANLSGTMTGTMWVITKLDPTRFGWTDEEGGGKSAAENGEFIWNFPPYEYAVH